MCTFLCRLTIHTYTCGIQATNVLVFMTSVATAINACQGKTALVIDSLSSLLLFLHPPCTSGPAPSPAVCRWLLSMQQHHILALLHSDLHEEGIISQMNSITTSTMRVAPAIHPNSNQYAGVIHTTHRRLSGKILKQVWRFLSPEMVLSCNGFSTDRNLFNCSKLHIYGDSKCTITYSSC